MNAAGECDRLCIELGIPRDHVDIPKKRKQPQQPRGPFSISVPVLELSLLLVLMDISYAEYPHAHEMKTRLSRETLTTGHDQPSKDTVQEPLRVRPLHPDHQSVVQNTQVG